MVCIQHKMKIGLLLVVMLGSLLLFDYGRTSLENNSFPETTDSITGLAVAATSYAPPNGILDVLSEGESREYHIRGSNYRVTADFIGLAEARFVINGRSTGSVGNKQTYSISNHEYLFIKGIAPAAKAGQTPQVLFTLTNLPDDQLTNNLTLKGHSYSLIALGGAFGSYFDPQNKRPGKKPLCKPQDFYIASWVHAPTTREFDIGVGETGKITSTYENILLYEAGNPPSIKQNGHLSDIIRVHHKADSNTTGFNGTEAVGAWVLNNGDDCEVGLNYRLNSGSSPAVVGVQENTSSLVRGWNLVSVTPHMVGKKLSDLQGSCELFVAYANYNNISGYNKYAGNTVPLQFGDQVVDNYILWSARSHVMDKSEVGIGMWLLAIQPQGICEMDLVRN